VLGMTQAEIAELADVAPETVSRIERNKIATSLELTRKLADALHVSIDELFHPAGRPKKPPLRPAESRLLAVVRELDDAQVDEVTRALKSLMGLGRTKARPPAADE